MTRKARSYRHQNYTNVLSRLQHVVCGSRKQSELTREWPGDIVVLRSEPNLVESYADKRLTFDERRETRRREGQIDTDLMSPPL